MKKRKLNQIDNVVDPPQKRAKTMHKNYALKKEKKNENNAWKKSLLSKNNSNTDDEQQYNIIFKAIDESEIIKNMQIPEDVVQQISDCTIGNLLNCFTKDCEEQISFLQNEKFEGLDQGLKCGLCKLEQYSTLCTFCVDECTSMDDVGTHCDECKMAGCHDCVQECDKCGDWWCKECWDLEQNCMSCYRCILE